MSGWSDLTGHGREADLLARCRARDETAWRELYATHSAAVGRYVRYLFGPVPDEDVEDIVQQVFVGAVKELDDFRSESTLRTWLCGIAKRVREKWDRSEYRHSRRQRKLALSQDPSLGHDVDTYERVENRAALRVAAEAMDSMDPRLRIAWFLSEVEGLSQEEISDALGVPVGTVRSRVYRARSFMVDALSEAGMGSGIAEEDRGTVVPLRPRS